MTDDEIAARIDVLEARLAHLVGVLAVLLQEIRDGTAKAAASELLQELQDDLDE